MAGRNVSGVEIGGGERISFPARFNVAVPFIDRHLTEGRGARRSARRTKPSPMASLRSVATGRGLLGRGLKPGDRVDDRPARSSSTCSGRHQGRHVPVPLNTPAARR